MHISEMQERSRVHFPLFANEQHYMVEFFQAEGLPTHLSHWQPTVDAMLTGIDTCAPIYFMADQKFVKAGTAHRRPGLHTLTVTGTPSCRLMAEGADTVEGAQEALTAP
jgi:hypothetical protein